METLLDLNRLTAEEPVGHLHTVEQRRKPTLAKETRGCLLLRWMACMKSKDGSESSSGTHHGGGNGGSGKTGATRREENERAKWTTMICAPTATRKATGPRSVARRSKMK
jgi:hypothetical protein